MTLDRTASTVPAEGALPPPRQLGALLLGRVLAPVTLWLGVLIGVGFLLGHSLQRVISGEDAVSRWFVRLRTPGWDSVTNVVSHVANTGTIIITMLSAAAVYWWLSRRPREAVALVVAVACQALVFLGSTLAVARERPDVPKLDQSPPTSSFPSGHTGAASALYFGLAMLCLTRLPSRTWRIVAAVGFGIVPLLVATARMYRGMHHPSDVTFGLLNGLVCVAIAWSAFSRPASG